jgi:hypoxanthine-DNA glycosylase
VVTKRIASPSRIAQPERRKRRETPLRGLPPVIAADARVLILGSFPSEASLAAAQYYAHPRNHFWPILGDVLHEPLAQLPYAGRLARVIAHRVAIWDTIVACERSGSLDSAIRNAEQGEIDHVRRIAVGLRAVCFNGKTAARARTAWAQAGYATLVMPSTSPAYTLPMAEKLVRWRELGHFLETR